MVGFTVVCDDLWIFVFFQAEDGIRDLVRSRGLGDVYKRQEFTETVLPYFETLQVQQMLILFFG